MHLIQEGKRTGRRFWVPGESVNGRFIPSHVGEAGRAMWRVLSKNQISTHAAADAMM
jgi:hypothetical protein